jgi:hypothetical protein
VRDIRAKGVVELASILAARNDSFCGSDGENVGQLRRRLAAEVEGAVVPTGTLIESAKT